MCSSVSRGGNHFPKWHLAPRGQPYDQADAAERRATVNGKLFLTRSLRQNVVNHTTAYIGETLFTALMEVRQCFVIESQDMQDCGVQVV